MSSRPDSSEARNIADRIENLKHQILARWREAVRGNPEQAALIHKLDDQELRDHFPGLTEKIIKSLRGEPAENLEQEAAHHGRQRRALGYSVVPLLRELQIFRRVLTDMAQEIVGTEANIEEIERGRCPEFC